jgi:hypothetical protein
MKVDLIDINIDRLIAHFLCVIEDGRVLVGSKGVVGEFVVPGNEIGIAYMGKGSGGDTDAEILKEIPIFEG